jgi:carbon storage regulator
MILLLSIPDAFLFPRHLRIWRTSSVLSRTFILLLKYATTTNSLIPEFLRPPADGEAALRSVVPGHVAREWVFDCVAEPDPPGEPTRPAYGGKAMWVLSRKVGEKIVITDDICVTVVAIQGNRVRLGITAPTSVQVDRAEIHQRLQDFEPPRPGAAHPSCPQGERCMPGAQQGDRVQVHYVIRSQDGS